LTILEEKNHIQYPRVCFLSEKHKSNNERLQEIQEKLKNRSEEMFANGPDFDEPQYIGGPSKIFEDDERSESDK
jgi:hypothetical protein